MKKVLVLAISLILLNSNLMANDDVYSETNSYNINQTNSNNTYIDNSKVLSDNKFNFTLFSSIGNDYSNYMNYESILYIDAYATVSFDGSSQYAIGAQIGIYENIYLLGHYGVFSQGVSSAEYNENVNYNDNIYIGEGNYIDYGLSYHILNRYSNAHMLISLDFIHRKMLNTEYKLVDFSKYNIEDYKGTFDNNFFMIKWTYFKPNAHTGFELGMGLGGVDSFVITAGLKFRYF
jgi:hypothetical protein